MARCTLEQLRDKEVINVCDGRRLGCVEDIEFEVESGKICALIIEPRGGFLSFGKEERLFVPWSKIKRIRKKTRESRDIPTKEVSNFLSVFKRIF